MLDAAVPDGLRWRGGNDRVPYWIYTSQAVFDREIARIFKGDVWNYTALECEIPNAGDFKRGMIGDQPIVLVRRPDGSIGGFLNRCAHRGVAFCQHDHGTVREFICPYHQWSYDLDGALQGVPFRRGIKGHGGMPADFDPSAHGLTKVRVHCRSGAIFVSMGAETPDFETYMGPRMLGYFDRVFDGRGLRLLGHSRQLIAANWKLMIENIKDPYHASLLHVFFVTFGLFRVDQRSKVQMDETGLHTALVSQRGEQVLDENTSQMMSFEEKLVLADPRLLDTVREFPGDATVVMHTIWPNLILQQQSNTLATRELVPIGPDSFELRWTFFGYDTDDAEMVARRLRQANMMGPAGLVSMDDAEIITWTQQGMKPTPEVEGVVEMGGRDGEDSDHMVTEAALRAFYRGYRLVMGL